MMGRTTVSEISVNLNKLSRLIDRNFIASNRCENFEYYISAIQGEHTFQNIRKLKSLGN
jgi:hypothetical protein